MCGHIREICAQEIEGESDRDNVIQSAIKPPTCLCHHFRHEKTKHHLDLLATVQCAAHSLICDKKDHFYVLAYS